jgi:penicillin-binding protein 1A
MPGWHVDVQADRPPDTFPVMARPSARTRKWWQEPLFRRRLLIAVLACAAFGVMAIVGLWTRACASEGACPSVALLKSYDPAQASVVLAADGRRLGDFGDERRTLLPLKEMSPAVPAAFLAIEDRRFYQHHGVDWLGMARVLKNAMLLRGMAGASTITMQLAGNIFPEQINRNKTGIKGIPRKIKEMHVAMEIERAYPKQKILELYLNKINFGNGYGVETAAQRYFGKSARTLNVAEAAILAALPKSPRDYNPRTHPDNAVKRRNLVIDAMQEDGYLTAQDATKWKAYPLALSAKSDYSDIGEYFVEYVRQQLIAAGFGDEINKGGLVVHTTLDVDIQQAAERALEAQLVKIENNRVARLGKWNRKTYQDYIEKRQPGDVVPSQSPYLQGGVLVLEAKTGNILAMVGGRDFNDSKFNRIVQAGRQPGSTFKPFMYSAAILSGMSFDDRFPDSFISVEMPAPQPRWEPGNYEGKFTDSVLTMREGLWRSLNSIAVRVGEKVGVEPVREEAKRFGLTTDIPTTPSIFLGSATVHPIEMIAAYTAFANLGYRTLPRAITLVEDRNGKKLLNPEVKTASVLDAQTAYTMNQALQGVVRRGTAAGAVYGAGFTIPAGGKTGTTNDGKDAWFIGFTKDLVAGVWVGMDDNTTMMRNAQGGLIAAPAWTQMMLDIYQRRRDPGDWEMNDQALIQVEIDKTTGFRATPFCPPEVRESRSYTRGAEPKEYCPVHSPFKTGGGKPEKPPT